MNTFSVKNKYKDIVEPNDVYIGRGSIWGNPYVIGKDGTREEVIQKYIDNFNLYDKVHLLKNKNLVCFCKPLPCHGDFLLKLARGTEQ